VIHDTGGIDGFTEPAVQQKDIADFFWQVRCPAGC